MSYELSVYEKNAIQSIFEWKNPPVTWWTKTTGAISKPFNFVGDLFTKVPGVDWVLEKSVGGLVDLLNDFAHWSVRPEAIYKEYRAAGHATVKTPQDIFKLDLEDADKVNGYLGAKYKSLAAAEGAAAGSVGLVGIAPDIVAIIALNQRAIAEYATYFGFDISSQQERLFALNILGYASSPDDLAKQVAMAQLVKIGQDVAKKKTWKVLEQHTFVQIIQTIAKSLGIRLTKAKLAQVVPATGAIVGGGFNAYYTSKVCDTAYYLYRERFLAEKYGADIIDSSVAPADSIIPDYQD
ncbi:EcsC family protein [Moritella sp. Urea-trap-13]|uniref:EcsC family protein n=1 Tax=Moritella sp. Urea-trap-13 TaxID=2058327 RepID=UPI000C324E80|nr:EcsC family protein [Moritella sp. Urea-trap-13]PKH07119.1 EcsC family protein [Moritella sp. Urea-trap-13]